ncbi:uncharacterized protein LOC111618395 [Centruroides sculpturatus]|uniref:uncharacterized protein LOC111618395 n=1 Tax=Centruroides sculpturatus TaxID=218467 RepID=UPI000C6DD134|nr:uncharacterized protein LOC111618395 [Centruroides sculpturatus]
MVYMERCCKFKNTKDGSMACAVFFMLMCLAYTSLYGYILSDEEVLISAAEMIKIGEDSAKNMFICHLTETVILFLCSLLLACGVKNNQRRHFLPWMCCVCLECLCLFAFLIFMIYTILTAGFDAVLLLIAMIVFSVFIFEIYMLMCVSSQYQLLADRSSPANYTTGRSNAYEMDSRFQMPNEVFTY